MALFMVVVVDLVVVVVVVVDVQREFLRLEQEQSRAKAERRSRELGVLGPVGRGLGPPGRSGHSQRHQPTLSPCLPWRLCARNVLNAATPGVNFADREWVFLGYPFPDAPGVQRRQCA